MDLEAAASYLLALAVPLWLVGEHVVHAWRTPHSSEINDGTRVEDEGQGREVVPLAP